MFVLQVRSRAVLPAEPVQGTATLEAAPGQADRAAAALNRNNPEDNPAGGLAAFVAGKVPAGAGKAPAAEGAGFSRNSMAAVPEAGAEKAVQVAVGRETASVPAVADRVMGRLVPVAAGTAKESPESTAAGVVAVRVAG